MNNHAPPATLSKGLLHAQKKASSKLSSFADKHTYHLANLVTGVIIVGISLSCIAVILGIVFITQFFLHQ